MVKQEWGCRSKRGDKDVSKLKGEREGKSGGEREGVIASNTRYKRNK